MSRRRTLRPEEAELWHAVVRNAHPMHPRKADPAPERLMAPAALKVDAPRPVFDAFRIGESARAKHGHDLVLPITVALRTSPLQMDAKAFGKMTRGKLLPEARIDLHGMTLSEAHPELIRFILNAHADGLRLVLVITGKGKRGDDTGLIPQRMGVLRHQVPQWLRQPPLGPTILQVAEAHLRHGGAGAYYVYLRRR
jgi:DNA-nicking Smr family endonuclease